ncbi:MAG: polynucleotide adenylyltransferase PcnB [Planctomycetes bacterium]|nr:polynucleotide adenylyltransferase PcnB [Planctomycetota bacterium]
MEPKVIPRSEHGISRRNIDPDALKILYRLSQSGHRAFLVGGSVRDLMLGIQPKDFDIATDARPRRLKKLFRNCRIIGRRFRLAHLHYPDGKIIEVATFRSSGESDEIEREGELIRRDNVFGSPEEDALRRDLTINALFYNIADFTVIDYVGGVEDLRARLIRTIADPQRSFREDPVRILRAIRHGTRLDFLFEEETERAIHAELAELLKVNRARLLEELFKDLCSGGARKCFEIMEEYGVLRYLLPDLVNAFRGRGARAGKQLWLAALDRLDELVHAGQPPSHALALGAFLAPIVQPVASICREFDAEPAQAVATRFQEVLVPALRHLRVYRRDEERLWQLFALLPKVARALDEERIPPSLARRSCFGEAAEVFALIEDESAALTRFLAEVRALPAPDPEAEEAPEWMPSRPRRRRRRRRRSDDREGDEEAAPRQSVALEVPRAGGSAQRQRRRRGGRRRGGRRREPERGGDEIPF